MERFTAKINLDQQISKYVKAGLSFNISRNNYDNVPLGNGENENSGIITAAVAFNPTVPVRDEKELFDQSSDASTPEPGVSPRN